MAAKQWLRRCFVIIKGKQKMKTVFVDRWEKMELIKTMCRPIWHCHAMESIKCIQIQHNERNFENPSQYYRCLFLIQDFHIIQFNSRGNMEVSRAFGLTGSKATTYGKGIRWGRASSWGPPSRPLDSGRRVGWAVDDSRPQPRSSPTGFTSLRMDARSSNWHQQQRALSTLKFHLVRKVGIFVWCALLSGIL